VKHFCDFKKRVLNTILQNFCDFLDRVLNAIFDMDISFWQFDQKPGDFNMSFLMIFLKMIFGNRGIKNLVPQKWKRGD
jgi:flagellar motor switch protein FliM